MHFHLLVSFSISFIDVLQFSIYGLVIFLAKFIPTYFMYYSIESGINFLSIWVVHSLCIEIHLVGIVCVYYGVSLNSFISSNFYI